MDTPLLSEDKLAILRTNDPRRKWISLDDRRVCVLCGRTITGRQIEVRRETGWVYSVHCPTPGCPAVPSDWFYQGTSFSPGNGANIRMSEATLWSD